MKATSIFIAALFLCSSFFLSAQTTAIWQGGKPGRATDWNCPANWSEGHVPGESTQVIIPNNANYYPVIRYASDPIDALLVEGGAVLTIQAGARFSIHGESGIFDGLTLMGRIENNGILEFGEAVNMNIALLEQVQGNGIVVSASTGVDTLAKRR